MGRPKKQNKIQEEKKLNVDDIMADMKKLALETPEVKVEEPKEEPQTVPEEVEKTDEATSQDALKDMLNEPEYRKWGELKHISEDAPTEEDVSVADEPIPSETNENEEIVDTTKGDEPSIEDVDEEEVIPPNIDEIPVTDAPVDETVEKEDDKTIYNNKKRASYEDMFGYSWMGYGFS